MQSRFIQTIKLLLVAILFMQTSFFSLGANANTFASYDSFQIIMTTNGEFYKQGDISTMPVEISIQTASQDSAAIEFSQDYGTTWEPFDVTSPYIVTEDGEHTFWFRLAHATQQRIERIIHIQSSQPVMTQLSSSTGNIIFVKKNATGLNNGTSWTDAFTDLQSALDVVTAHQEIWVAAGTYVPTTQTKSDDARTATFQLKNDVAIYGGFIGDEINRSERDWQNNPTVLSGDLDDPGDKSDNAYHVIHHPNGLSLNETAILDGFTIRDGNADSPVFMRGGGMRNDDSSPSLVNIIFSHNYAAENGGAIYNVNSKPVFTNVTFTNNEAVLGGALYNDASSSTTLTNVMFTTNKATSGGALYNEMMSSTTLNNTIFQRNEATSQGGALFNKSGKITLTNALIALNKASDGPAMFNSSFSSSIVANNVTIAGNEATDSKKFTISNNGVLGLYNSIVIGNHNQQSLASLSSWTIIIEKSLLDTKVDGEIVGHYYTNKSTPSTNTYKPEHIFINPTQHNYELRGNSPALNRGDNTDNNLLTDLLGNPRILGGTIDLGAYEASPYSVMYDANTGTGDVPVDISTYNENDFVTVMASNGTISKQGHLFIGWNTAADGTGSLYQAGDTVPIVANDLTLYAAWIPTYTVVYDGNGATSGLVPLDNTSYLESEQATVLNHAGDLTKTDYVFKGWNTQSDGSGDFYQPGETLQIGQMSITLYAVWEPTYTILYDANGATSGVAPVDNKRYEQHDTATVLGNSGNLAKTGYTFKGWNTKADGSGTTYAAGDSFLMDAQNLTLFAEWILNPTYGVMYDANGATSGVAPLDNTRYEQHDTATVLGNSGNLAKTGYTFKGWNTKADGSGTLYAAGASFLMDAQNLTLFAEWTLNPTYEVVYDANGATSGVAPLDNTRYEQHDTVTVLGNTGNLVKTGHTFKGWNTKADGSGTLYAAGASFLMATQNLTLFAEWTLNPTYDVAYDANGATSGVAPLDNTRYEQHDTVTVLGNSGNLVKTGYTFKGWNTKADGSGTTYAAGDSFLMAAQNLILFAEWTAKQSTSSNSGSRDRNTNYTPSSFTITLNTNGGGLLTPIQVESNVKIGNLPIPIKENYQFDGWYEDAALTKPWHNDTIVKQNMNLYAKWTSLPPVIDTPLPDPETIFVDLNGHWAKEMIEELAQMGIIQGYEDQTFRPNEPISRMHVAALLTRSFDLKRTYSKKMFLDVPATHPYYTAIYTLQQAGIVDGSNGSFLPNENITRAQLAKILVGIMGLQPLGTSSFADVPATHWSTGYIAVLEHKGIALGDEGKFNLNHPVTRAQFVAFLHRIMQQTATH